MAFSLQISEKRLLGWEPVEVHEHERDDDGRLVRTTVTREAEWDDQERAKMLALVKYEADVCDCGLPTDYADTDPDLQLRYRVCPVCAGMAKAMRIQQDADEKSVKALGATPPPDAARPSDGRFMRLEPKADQVDDMT